MYRHLLVPIDQSELSIINVGEAVKLARSLGAKVTFFHANVDYSTTVQGFRSRAQTEDRLHRTSQFLGGSVPAEPTPEPTTDQYREHTLAQSRPLLAKAGAAAASKTVAYKLEALDAITIAEIGGAAMGAGLELALSCDLRVVAKSAKLALPEVGIGLLPAAGGTQRLTRLCGRAHAIRMICAGDTLTSEQAYSVGLADYTVADQDLRNFVDELARRIAVKPAPALRMAKRCILAQNSIDDDGFAMERLAAGKLLRQEETRALIQKFFERSAQRASGR